MHLTARQLPDNPAVNRTEKQFAFFRTFACASSIIKQPAQFGCRKISVQHQPRFAAEELRHAKFFQFVAIACRAAALPHNRFMYRASGFFIPQNRGFALIGNANARNFVNGNINFTHCFIHQAGLGCPYFLRVMLNPAGLRKILGKLLLRRAANPSVFIKYNAAAAGCP